MLSGLKISDSMTLKAFKGCIKVHFKLHENLKPDYKMNIDTKEINLHVFNSFSAKHVMWQ